ncbi:hypothetical protein VTK56DRAFT_9212 [Thermocarpiscus australiensis]
MHRGPTSCPVARMVVMISCSTGYSRCKSSSVLNVLPTLLNLRQAVSLVPSGSSRPLWLHQCASPRRGQSPYIMRPTCSCSVMSARLRILTPVREPDCSTARAGRVTIAHCGCLVSLGRAAENSRLSSQNSPIGTPSTGWIIPAPFRPGLIALWASSLPVTPPACGRATDR